MNILNILLIYISSVQSLSRVWLWPNGLQHTRLPCPSPTPRACSNSCPLSRWCRPTISSSVVSFSSWLQSFPASGSFPVSQFFVSRGQNIGASVTAPVLPMNIQDWLPLKGLRYLDFPSSPSLFVLLLHAGSLMTPFWSSDSLFPDLPFCSSSCACKV